MNIEAKLIEYLNDELDVPVSTDVPKKRPESFVTIERTGGALTDVVIDHADVAIQAWAPSRLEAAELMDRVDSAVLSMDFLNFIEVSRDSLYNFPDYEYSMARYQGLYEIVFYKED